MKKVLTVVFLVGVLALSACKSSTEYGPCVGAFDEKNPKLVYKVSAWNVAMGVVFFQLIAPPIFVLVDETFCPVGTKDEQD